jgi:hypothetical protein
LNFVLHGILNSPTERSENDKIIPLDSGSGGGRRLFMAILDTTIVSVTLPQMQKAFHTDFETITWVASAYFLAQAAVIPIVGYLSDRVGTKLIFLTALILFTVGSALCAFAPTKEALIAFRVFQGIGGGALLPMAYLPCHASAKELSNPCPLQDLQEIPTLTEQG